MIRFACPGCGAVYTVADEKGGKTGKCPKCQSQFNIPMPEAAASPPPPPPPAPAKDFAFTSGGDEDEDEAPPTKKKPQSRVDSDNDDDAPPPKKKSRSKADVDDEDDGEKSGPPQKGKGLAIAAGVVHIVFGLLTLTCGVLSIIGGSCLTAAGNANTTSTVFKNDPILKNDKQFQQNMEKMNAAQKNMGNYGTIALGIGACNSIVGILMIPAGIGCFMRKPFGKLLSYVVGPFAVLLSIVEIISKVIVLGTEYMNTMTIITGLISILIFTAYAGFTIFAAIKGIPAGGVKSKKSSSDDDYDDAPPSKSSKRKPTRDDDDDDDRPKKKKRPRDDDD